MASLYWVGCADDESPASVLPYRASAHIYGTFGQIDNGFWEVVIDPATGHYEKLVASEETLTARSPRVGAFALTAFERNELIYGSPPSRLAALSVQDLETFEISDIALRDTLLGQSMVFPQLLRFGASQNEVFLMDTDRSIWHIDLDSRAVRKVHDGLPVPAGGYVCHFFHRSSDGHFLVMTNEVASNAYTADKIHVINPALPNPKATLSTTTIPSGFGFLQHPVDRDAIYYIQRAQSDKGFRLMKITMSAGGMNISEISQTDLPIENLSPYLQTIHTATNTYILRGGSSSLDAPSNVLYSIDLNNGKLVREVPIRDAGFLLKLAGE